MHGSLVTTMAEEHRFGTTRFLECVGQHREAGLVKVTTWHLPFQIDRLGETPDNAVVPQEPLGVDAWRRTERIGEDTAEHATVAGVFNLRDCVPVVTGTVRVSGVAYGPGSCERGILSAREAVSPERVCHRRHCIRIIC
jgi:hypothetical protein